MRLDPKIVLSVLLGLSFTWPGVHKIVDPGYWEMWLPAFLRGGYFSDQVTLQILAGFELAVGLGLMIPAIQRYAGLIGAGFLIAVLAVSGVTAVTFRDLGLLGGTLYLALTGRKINLSVPKLRFSKSMLFPVIGAFVVIGVSFPLVDRPFTSSAIPESTVPAPTVDFLIPLDGGRVSASDLDLTFRVLFDAEKMGLNHVHVRLDGRVVDVIYLPFSGEKIISRLSSVAPGTHTVTVSFAYLDHIEMSDKTAQITFTVN